MSLFRTFSGAGCLLCLTLIPVGLDIHAQSLNLEQIAQSTKEYESLFMGDEDPASLAIELRRLVPFLPEFILRSVVQSDSIVTTPRARASVLSWWRSQDPLPASQVNERMIEHVRRIQYALEHYACSSCPTGYDDRGEIYVRYGAPERMTEIVFDDPLLIDAIYQPGVAVSPGDFPSNEFWRYLNLDQDLYFLFIQKDHRYRLGDTSDLLPSVLQAGLGYGGRGQVKSRMLLAVMRSVYRQLALEHSDFGSRFNDVDLWLSSNEEAGRLQSRDILENAKIIVGAGLMTQGERSESMDLGQDAGQPASIFAQNMILNAKSEDEQASYQRDLFAPVSSSDVLQAFPDLELSVRYARFLEPDGTTTTQIYWHPESWSFIPPGRKTEDEYLIEIFAALKSADHTILKSTTDAIRVEVPVSSEHMIIPVQTIQMSGSADLYHLALQWNQFGIRSERVGAERVGPRLRVTSRRIDSLQALDASGLTLEMSDLKPLLYTEKNEPSPWPHSWIHREMKFGLEFEIYHLTYGARDQTNYRITYEVTPLRRRTSSTSVEFEGLSRVEKEAVRLDLGRRTGPIEVTVRVQDLVSGSQVSRSLTLTMHDDE